MQHVIAFSCLEVQVARMFAFLDHVLTVLCAGVDLRKGSILLFLYYMIKTIHSSSEF